MANCACGGSGSHALAGDMRLEGTYYSHACHCPFHLSLCSSVSNSVLTSGIANSIPKLVTGSEL